MTRETESLVASASKVVKEIEDTRTGFRTGKLGGEQAKVFIGLFNATARVITTAINAERWARQQIDRAETRKVTPVKKNIDAPRGKR